MLYLIRYSRGGESEITVMRYDERSAGELYDAVCESLPDGVAARGCWIEMREDGKVIERWPAPGGVRP